MAEDGHYYYIPDTGEVEDYVTQLLAGDVEGAALGGEHLVVPLWIPLANHFPWWIGLGVVPFLFNRDKDSDPESTAELKPDLRLAARGEITKWQVVKNDDPNVDPNSVKLLDSAGNQVSKLETQEGTWEVLADGNIKFTPVEGFDKLNKDWVQIKYTAKDKSGKELEPTTFTIGYPSVQPDTENGEEGKPVTQNVVNSYKLISKDELNPLPDNKASDQLIVKLIDPNTYKRLPAKPKYC